MKKFDGKGKEIPEVTPVSVPLGWTRPVSIHDLIKQAIRQEVSKQAVDDGEESFEEADDFDVDEDPDPLSQYEMRESQIEWPNGVKDDDASYRDAEERKQREEEERAETKGSASGRNRGGTAPAVRSDGGVEGGDEESLPEGSEADPDRFVPGGSGKGSPRRAAAGDAPRRPGKR